MKIAYPLKQCPADPRVVLDANLSVICTFLEGEHAEEMVERMNNHYEIIGRADDFDDADKCVDKIDEALEVAERSMSDMENAVENIRSIIQTYSVCR
jgi:hypothetical protein